MKNIFLLAFAFIFIHSNAQQPTLKSSIEQLAKTLNQKCNEPGTTKVAILGLNAKNGSVNAKFISSVKEDLSIALNGNKYKVIDPLIIDEVVSELQWTYSKKGDQELLEKIAMAVFTKNDMIVSAFLWGEIEDAGDEIKITAVITKSEIYTLMGIASVKAEATEETDKLLGKAISHVAKKVEPVQTSPAPTATTASVPESSASEAVKIAEVSKSSTTTTTTTSTTTETAKFRGGADPLKGLNVSEEKKALQVGTYYALVIGIDNYKGEWAKLANAVNDAKALETLLKTKYKFDAFRTLYNDQATRENIITEFEWLIQNVKESDNVLIYYSGHGEYKQELNKGFWVPIDATSMSTSKYISNNDIQTYLSGIKSKHTLLISDACFSGDIFRGKTITIPFEESDRYYSKIYNLTSRKAITSGGIEPVMDGGRDGHSVFAYYLLKNLSTNANSFYDASQLFDAIKIPVVNNSQQSPNFQPIKDTGDEGGQFIFIKK